MSDEKKYVAWSMRHDGPDGLSIREVSDVEKCYAWSMRLVRELAELRAALCECSQIVATPSREADHDYIIEQIKVLVGNVKCMAKQASEVFATIEPQVTENVARFTIKRPDGWLTTTAMVFDAAWRSVRQVSRQWSQPDAPGDAVLHRFAKCADMLAAFDNVELLTTQITTELRSTTIATAKTPDVAPVDPWELHCETMEANNATHFDTANTWKARHPNDAATVEELQKKSKNYRSERNRKRKAAENPRRAVFSPTKCPTETARNESFCGFFRVKTQRNS